MRFLLPLATLGLITACTPDYPFDKAGTWSLDTRPDANNLNLRAMVTNPHDLTQGSGEAAALGAEANRPVARLISGHRAKLPSSGLIQLQGVSDSSSAAPDNSEYAK